MRPVAKGRPGTRVIPEGWAAAHQPVIEDTLSDAVVELRDPNAAPTSSSWDNATEQMVTVPVGPYWSGGARVQMLNQQGRQPVAAEDPETTAGYLIVIPASVAGVAEGHRVKVTTSDDALLSGKTLRVVAVVRGSHRWERDLFCELTD